MEEVIKAENPEDLAHKIVAENMSVSDTDKMVKNAPRAKNTRKHIQKTIDTTTVQDIESKIKSALNVPAKLIERRGGAGQIVLSFSNRNQLFDLVDKIVSKK